MAVGPKTLLQLMDLSREIIGISQMRGHLVRGRHGSFWSTGRRPDGGTTRGSFSAGRGFAWELGGHVRMTRPLSSPGKGRAFCGAYRFNMSCQAAPGSSPWSVVP